jgi:hypothetical protein
MGSFSKLCVAVATIGSLAVQIRGEKPHEDVSPDFLSKEFFAKLRNPEKDTGNAKDGFVSKMRELQSNRACNQQFSVAQSAELLLLVDFFLELVLGADSLLLGVAQNAISSAIKFDIAAIKVCLSCEDIGGLDLEADALSNDSTYGFLSYCAEDSYGYTATHSALVFAPIDPSTGEIFTGLLRGFISGHGIVFDTSQGPSDIWPSSVSSTLVTDQLDDEDKLFIFADAIAASISASSGAVSVLPDYIGYGESRDFNRTFLTPLPYMQAYAVSFLAAKRFISNESNGCTELDDVGTVTGYSEGGYSSVVGALALEQNGVDILSVHAGGTPWDLDTHTGSYIGKKVDFEFVYHSFVGTALTPISHRRAAGVWPASGYVATVEQCIQWVCVL